MLQHVIILIVLCSVAEPEPKFFGLAPAPGMEIHIKYYKKP
jgi:hypothetical protein